MTRIKDPKIFIEHILDSIAIIDVYTKKINRVKFKHNLAVQDSVIRRIAIIGEAVSNLSKLYKYKYPDIPWRDISDMRNLIIHEYYDVDLDVAWDTVKLDLPKLKKRLKEILKEID